jgi:hypothetical protein
MTTERAPPTASHWRRHNLVAAAEAHTASAAAVCVCATVLDFDFPDY